MIDGQLFAEQSLVVSESGRIHGEVYATQIVVNGIIDGECHADHIQILAQGRVNGKIWSNNLSIEPGGKFFGETSELQEKEVVKLLDTQFDSEPEILEAKQVKTGS